MFRIVKIEWMEVRDGQVKMIVVGFGFDALFCELLRANWFGYNLAGFCCWWRVRCVLV